MLNELKNLSENEKEFLLDIPALIFILVAGADGKIDEKETTWAEKIKKFRTTKENSLLNEYFTEAGINFRENVEEFLTELPGGLAERSNYISKKLSRVNDILPKLDKKFAVEFYKSMLTYAKQIASASGGILGFDAISPEERRWINLEMINNPEDNYISG